MQFEQFAREIVIDADCTTRSRTTVTCLLRPFSNAVNVVEIGKHRRMGGNRVQHIGEAAIQVGVNPCFPEVTNQFTRRFLFAYGEVIQPEPGQSLPYLISSELRCLKEAADVNAFDGQFISKLTSSRLPD